MERMQIPPLATLAGALLVLGIIGAGTACGEWTQIPLDGPIDYELPDGTVRTLEEALDSRPLDDPRLPIEWYLKMQLITNATEGLRNYRSFIDGGTYHTILGSATSYT
jgi:hypothetical protein